MRERLYGHPSRVFTIHAAVAILLLGLRLWVTRAPLPALGTSLALYAMTVSADALGVPSVHVLPWLVHILVIGTLGAAMLSEVPAEGRRKACAPIFARGGRDDEMKRLSGAGLVALASWGCAVEMEGSAVGEDVAATSRVTQALASSTVVNKRGVVEVEILSLSKCTGVMINGSSILTAKACTTLGEEGTEESYLGAAKIWYFDPDLDAGEKRRITAGTPLGPPPLGDGYDLVDVNINLPEGIALITRRSGTWVGTNSSDYQRISLDDCWVNRHATLYGRGTGAAGQGAGVLRATPTVVDQCSFYWFMETGAATCPGDYGAPYIGKAGSFDVITGLLTQMSGGTPNCANGGTLHGVQLGYRLLAWIEEVAAHTCWTYEVDGRSYARCWDCLQRSALQSRAAPGRDFVPQKRRWAARCAGRRVAHGWSPRGFRAPFWHRIDPSSKPLVH